ncbi:Formylmethanofuran dehydrogenase subunit C [Treponema sp. JC4]|uniref:right-handed parallel beta-helix repeat-containing protein n=1 Tax=Treponema sp. JC4 TaxID=1124982 RepID=UPI00025B09E9|nr:right-handed parallel beta-helix repeat-containing protein [Treponema sp. JC4]EID85908.1 Formylmethanofuran dehydrogenase subunit C [Treponema sp. JC4]
MSEKRIITKSFLSVLTFIFLIFSSCNNLFDNDNNSSSEVRYVTVSGAINPGTALPTEYASLLTSAQAEIENTGSKRTAWPSIPGGLTYKITAKNTAQGSTETIDGTHSTDYSSYTIKIPLTETEKNYKIYVSVIYNEIEIFSGESKEFSISTANQVVSEDITLSVNQTSTAPGSISLEIDVSETDIQKCIMAFSTGQTFSLEAADNKIITRTEGNPIEKEKGTYNVSFNFYDNSDKLLYSFTEIINVLSDFVTNTWVQNGDEPYFVTTGTGSAKTTTCKITPAMVDGFALTEFYISADGDSANSGTFLKPLKTIDDAVKLMHNKNKDYTIFINGKVEGAQSISDTLSKTEASGTYHAKTLTIRGASGSDSDSLHLTSAGTVLSISTDVPVTIKDLKIQGSDSSSAATTGLSLESGISTDVTISSGVVITNNYNSGVIIGDSGKLTMTGGQITKNQAKKGAGVMNNGTFIMSGGRIERNTTTVEDSTDGDGGGVYSTNKMIMTDGYIWDNTAGRGTQGDGGGVLFSGTFDFQGGSIYGNLAYNRGGGIFINGGTLFMSGSAVIGNITSDKFPTYDTSTNRAFKNGGGIYSAGAANLYIGYTNVSSDDPNFSGGIGFNYAAEEGGGIFATSAIEVFKIAGGIVKNNTAEKNGGAIYAGGDFTLLKKAYIPAGTDNKNDVYLVENRYIFVTEGLTGTAPIATITPPTYSASKQVLNGTESLIAASCAKFALSDNDWIIGKDGKCYSTIITTIGYTLPDIFKQISSDSTKPIKIRLESDIAVPLPNYFEVTYPLVVEGNHKISGNYDKALFTIKEGGKLTIKEGVEVEYTGSDKAAISIENGEVNIEGTESSPVKISASAYNPSGILINDGILKAKNLTISATNKSSLTIAGGSVSIENMTANNTTKSTNGGGIYISGGTSTLTNCEISGNKLSASGGSNYMGGGIFMASGTLTLNKCTIQNNIAAYYGGVGNTPTHGGGIFARNGSRITISDTTISGNGVSEGGVIEGKQYYFESGVIYNGTTLSEPLSND